MKLSGILAASLAAIMVATSAQAAEKLVIAGRDGVYADALKLAVSMYNKTNPDVEIEQLALPIDGLQQQITLSARENVTAYDVIMMDDTWAPLFMSNNWLADLDKLGGGLDDDFAKGMRDVSKWPVGTGTTYAVPFIGNVELFAYRSDLMAQPKTWDDVIAAADANNKGGVSGLVFRGKKANPIVSGFVPLLWAYGGDIIGADGKASLDSAASLNALNTFLKLATYAPKGVEAYDAPDIQDALQQGKTAMSMELWPSWAANLDNADKSKVVGKVAIMPTPGQVNPPAAMLGSWLLGIPANAANKEGARKFVDFMTSAEVQKQLALQVGTPPTRGSVYSDPELVAKYRWFPAQFEALQNARPRPRITQWAQVESIMGDYLQLALIGDMEPAAALKEANAKIADALK
ncbi:MAG TPA: ABC transporter substrate-binding protein [Devosiaceae bacterium]|jgi:multiple sugar transport system substrate-binding protein